MKAMDFLPILQNTCYGCLKVSDDVHNITCDEINLYKEIVMIISPDNMYMCNICSHLLKKTRRFVDQCQEANKILNKFFAEGRKPDRGVKYLSPIHNFTTTSTKTDEFREFYNSDDNDIYIDDEDIPLTMLKNEEENFEKRRRRKKKRRSMNQEKNGTPNIASEPNSDNKEDFLADTFDDLEKTAIEEMVSVPEENIKTKKRKGANKLLREGFSSKMVQETEEYTVIKLSKEQVRKEMEDKAGSEQYIRCLYKCGLCVKGYNFEDVLNAHMERHNVKQGWLECELCHQYCPNATSFRGHMKSHTTRYKCKVCGCVRLSRQVLLEHHATHTSDAAEYRCQQCDFVSNKRTSMQRHVRMRHNKADKQTCELCGKTLHSVEALRTHTTRHDKSKRVQCDECSKWFVYPALLRQHKVSVHLRGDYYCVECDIKFQSRGNLILHFKRHKRHRDVTTFKHECAQCHKRFLFPSALVAHSARAHGAGDRFPCACGRLYATRDSLRAHQRRAHAHSKGDSAADPEECHETLKKQEVTAEQLIEGSQSQVDKSTL